MLTKVPASFLRTLCVRKKETGTFKKSLVFLPLDFNRKTERYRMNQIYRVLLSMTCVLAVSCQSTDHQPETKTDSRTELQKSLDVNFVTQEEAVQRSARVSQVHYQLKADLTGNDKNFSGKMLLSFQLSDANSDLKVDLSDAKISDLNVNGTQVSDFVQGKRFFLLPQKSLKIGDNQVSITYEGTYSHSGEGLHRFVDPVDQRAYLYTQFEAFDANRFMPCFDQPDLKAKLQLTVLAPLQWTVVSNTLETTKHKTSNASQEWVFPDTATISTYLFALHAGEYKIWKSSFGKIPLRLFARQSLAKYVTPEDWFRVTRQGLGFYQGYFAFAYPFVKYDQLIVPEFNAGAMENVAAVTFSERMIRRGKETRDFKSGTAETILHEMAHMWFGDLVTMKWWNDLWLNESFADFMEDLAATNATEFTDASMDVFAGSKQWAYREDQLITTHPIAANVKNTDESFTNFDGITYGKGAATFKQLSYSMGADVFKKGVQNYFKKYAYKNTQLTDFVGELAAASHQDLTDWTQSWLRDAGVDTLKVKMTCDAQKISSLNLEIINSGYSKLTRSHAFELAFLYEKKSQVKVTQTLRVLMNQKSMDVKEAVGLACPQLAYPNYHDNDYMKLQLDEITLANLKTSYAKLEDPFMRLMFASAIWQMVRDQSLKLADYNEIILGHIVKETNLKVLKLLFGTIAGGRRIEDSTYLFMPSETPVQQEARTKFVARVEELFMSGLKEAPAGSDLQMAWFDALITATETPSGLTQLFLVFDGSEEIPGLKVDQDRRWSVLQQMCKFNVSNVTALVAEEEKKDISSRAKESSLACIASIPTLDNKKSWYAQVKSEKTEYSLEQIGQIAKSIFPYQQRDLQKAFVDDYFDFLAHSFDRDQEYLSTVSHGLVPAMCDVQSATRIQQFASSSPKMPAVLVKNLKMIGQDDERCAKIHAFNSH